MQRQAVIVAVVSWLSGLIGEGNHTGSEIDPEATALPRKEVDRPLPKGMLGVLLMEDTSGYCP